jgi:hypothetical protein
VSSITLPGVPRDVLPLLKEQLEAFGSTVSFETPTSGVLSSVAGKLHFEHRDDETLVVEVIENEGHFPEFLIIGGIRQTVQEAVEIHRQRIARV